MTADDIEELFARTLQGNYDDSAPWEAVSALRQIGTRQVLERAVTWIQSDDPLKRTRGIDVLAQLGKTIEHPANSFPEESYSLAASALNDSNQRVVESAAWALAHLGGALSTSKLIGLAEHPDPQVRRAVAFGLTGSENPEAVTTLVALSTDEDDEVRNWATFGLGLAGSDKGPPARLGTLDSPEIRDALRSRLTDPFSDARDEAIWGLARRKDPAALRLLLDRLDSKGRIAGDEIVAAEILGLDLKTPLPTLSTGLKRLLSS
jgi:HEAT repeat protein